MADLSGLYIKGTGSYEVKEIAPPTQTGQLVVNSTFNGLTGWVVTSPNAANQITAVDGGGMRMVSDGTADVFMSQNIMEDNLWYKCVIDVESITGSFDVGPYNNVWKSVTTAGVHVIYGKSMTGIFFYLDNTDGIVTDAVINSCTLEQVPIGYPLLDKGSTYLECTSAGNIAFPNTQAYGEWEFDWYHGNSSNLSLYLTSSNKDGYNTTSGFAVNLIGVTFDIRITEYITTTANINARSNPNAFTPLTWYRCKVTRTLDGETYLYIKGGEYGVDDWTLVDASVTGSNPFTDNTVTKSEYCIISSGLGSRIANIVMRPAVKQ